MRCPRCGAWKIQELLLRFDRSTPIYQCQKCGLLFGKTPGGELYKGTAVLHEFNPTARDGKN